MRIKFKRNCLSYVVSVSVLSFLVTLYVIGLRQNKQVGTNFNLKPKVRRDVHGSSFRAPPVPVGLVQNTVKPLQRNTGAKHVLDLNKRRNTGVILDKSDQVITLNRTSYSGDKTLNVYIVEEHHEVIPYWFGAARRGTIPKTGNTLIHIDGHSDLAPPRFRFPEYPFFRWPSEKQLKYLMQSNDAFIQASGMAGLLDRFIWVWPDWDHPNHENQYVLNTLGLGWAYMTKNNRKTKEKTFCMCMSLGNGRECRSTENTGKEGNKEMEDGSGYNMNHKNCKIKKNIIAEEVHENKILALLARNEWLANTENVILDIDEDYFGCTYAIEPLLSANMSYEKIEELDVTIATQICPLSTAQEKEADILLMDLIAAVRVKRACKIDPSLVNSTKCRTVSKLDIANYFETLLKKKVSEKDINLCDNYTEIHKFILNVLRQLGRLRIKQLRALQKTGFCSETSTKTYRPIDSLFRLCYGANTPRNTEILAHMPSRSEILGRKVILKNILEKINILAPNIVTVCRSVRDGYTPREYFELIEDSVLSTLNQTLDKELVFHYDKDLIGGKPGWPARHKV